jgi:hypothetical protein
MYHIDTSGLLAYIGTMFSLVGGALKLDPAVFQTFFDYSGKNTGLGFWIVFVAGLSMMMGQSVVLFANRIKPARFAISMVMGAISFVISVAVVALSVWVIGTIIGPKEWGLSQITRAIALVSAPYWLSFLVLIPYAGIFLERLLKIYVFLALMVAMQTVFHLTFGSALSWGLLVLRWRIGLNTLIGRMFTPADHLADTPPGWPGRVKQHPRNLRDVCQPQSIG